MNINTGFPEKTKGKAIVFGFLFGYPMAGITYQYLHYMIGLRRLGYDVYYVEDSSRWLYDLQLNELTTNPRSNIESAVPILEDAGFKNRWAFRYYPDGECHGMTENQLLTLYKDADFFFNVTGAQEIREEHLACPKRIYVESDPFNMQVHVSQGNESKIDELEAHNVHFTFGENLISDDFIVPLERFDWLTTRQPVLMEFWDNPYKGMNGACTTITSWKSKGNEVTYQGETYYWTKDREFVKFIDLPKHFDIPFELAVKADSEAEKLIDENGWRRASSVAISADTQLYKQYIQQSRAEFTVARDVYVRPETGWFSDRSACYLAAGRPVITQETGFSKYIPCGEGLFSFETLDDVLAAVDEIQRNYEVNCNRAREIAIEYFSAEKVIGSMLERAGI